MSRTNSAPLAALDCNSYCSSALYIMTNAFSASFCLLLLNGALGDLLELGDFGVSLLHGTWVSA